MTVAAAVAQDVPVYLDEVGKCVAREVVSIQPQVSGRITELHFKDGADVKKGDLLFTIDPRPYEAQLHAAQADLARSAAALNLAKSQWTRAETLIATKAISQEEYDTRKNAVDLTEAQVRQATAATETARLNLEYCSIRSPIDGRAGHRLVDVGNVVKANETTLLTIERLDPIYADFTVAQNDLTSVQRNMKQGELKVEVRLPDEPAQADSRRAHVSRQRRRRRDRNGHAPRDGSQHGAPPLAGPLRARCGSCSRRSPARSSCPAVAPQLSGKGPFVYVVKADSTAEMRPVKTGQRQGDSIVIEEGVKAGERIVVTGQLGVTPGGKVQEQAAAPPAGAAGGKS